MNDNNDLQAWLDFRDAVESLILDEFRETSLNEIKDINTWELVCDAVQDAASHGIYWRFTAILDHVYPTWVSLPLNVLQHYGGTLVYAAWNYIWNETNAASRFADFASNIQNALVDLADRCDEKDLDADRCERAKLRLLRGAGNDPDVAYLDRDMGAYFIAAKDGGKYDK